MEGIFFSNTAFLVRTLVIGVFAYINLIVLLRLSGLRTLSKMNAFDLVVTVALGSTFATILLNRDVSLAQGTLAFALLIALQYVVSWTSVRSRGFSKLVTGEPRLLFFQGQFLSQALRAARVNEDEIYAAIRAGGHAALEEIDAVILESDGSFSVVKSSPDKGYSALADVRAPKPVE
uniref:DUF421 domain-containing protein n=1 Tax=Pantoea sp. IMH TaxID=1267600 RepID=UPI00046AFF94|nr:YetF domain-containing protein [Pantoea sp. IMH]